MKHMDLDTIRSATASDLVFSVLRRFHQDGPSVSPRGMKTYEARWCKYVLTDVTRCACWLPKRRINYPFMFAEFLWMFCGRRDVDMIAYYNPNIKKFSDDGETFYGAYGPPWRDQITGAVERIKRDPDSRQAVVCTWRPPYNRYIGDFPELLEQTKDVPCTLTMQYLLRDGKLEAGVNMRSSDAWLGLPYDIFNFAMLQRAVAAELQVEPGELNLYIGSSHLYERNLDHLSVVMDAIDNMAVSNMGEYTGLTIPGPPDLSYAKVFMAEGLMRQVDFDKLHGQMPSDITEWEALLSMLAYRRHCNPLLVHPSVRPLVLP